MDDCINNLLESILNSKINQITIKRIRLVLEQFLTQKKQCQKFAEYELFNCNNNLSNNKNKTNNNQSNNDHPSLVKNPILSYKFNESETELKYETNSQYQTNDSKLENTNTNNFLTQQPTPPSMDVFKEFSKNIGTTTKQEFQDILSKHNQCLPELNQFSINILKLAISGKFKLFKWSDLHPNQPRQINMAKYILARKELQSKKELIEDIVNHPNNKQLYEERKIKQGFDCQQYVLIMILLEPTFFDNLVDKLQLQNEKRFLSRFADDKEYLNEVKKKKQNQFETRVDKGFADIVQVEINKKFTGDKANRGKL